MAIVDKTKVIFSKYYKDLGELRIRDWDSENDLKTIHEWVTKPYAKYWGMQEYTLVQIKKEYQEIEAQQHHHARIGMLNDLPIFLMEYYDPKSDMIADHYEVKPGDVGMHILVAPVEKKIPKFTWKVFTTVMDFLFSDPTTKRIVVEPDTNNEKIHVLNKKAGFNYLKEIQFPHKTARLGICTREDYERAIKNLH